MYFNVKHNSIYFYLPGVPPTQVHKYGSLGCIDVDTVLKPLEFVLPKREVMTPVVDLSTELSSLTANDPDPILSDILEMAESPQPKEPIVDINLTEEPKSDDPDVAESALNFSDPELDAILNEPRSGGQKVEGIKDEFSLE